MMTQQNMRARIAAIDPPSTEDGSFYEVRIDLYTGRSWHFSALLLYAIGIHEGARIGLAICDKLNETPDYKSELFTKH